MAKTMLLLSELRGNLLHLGCKKKSLSTPGLRVGVHMSLSVCFCA